MNPFELALGIEAKQPLNLTIRRTKGTSCDNSKDVAKMAKGREKNEIMGH
jgi:hypothetical protein